MSTNHVAPPTGNRPGYDRLPRPLVGLLIGLLAASLLSFVLPEIALDTSLADGIVRITDTAYWKQMPLLCVVVLIILISRPGLTARRRSGEAGAIALAMLIALAGNALLNENVVKPAFGVHRPNIVDLAESGALGSDITDSDAFYAVGDKEARRELMGEYLPAVESPPLSDLVRAHWIHETGYAFPSGHSTAAVTLAILMAALGYSWLRGWRLRMMTVLVPLWAVAVVYSRILLGVHWEADVIAGTVAGFGWGVAAFFVIRSAFDQRATS
ncbi:MAG: phosphatase PAP2 family protein [Acidimicrobiia bacterium]|nr:phosphatase PAP2 family protein [Acidimicrobiia bacterium]